MRNIDIQPATAAALEAFYGRPFPVTARAIMATEAGRLLGVAGCYPQAESMVVFLKLTDDLRRHPRIIVRETRRLLKMARAHGGKVIAQVDEQIKGSARLLEFSGFRPVGAGMYVLEGA